MSGKIEVRQWAKRLRFASSWPVEDFAQGNRVQDLEVDSWRRATSRSSPGRRRVTHHENGMPFGIRSIRHPAFSPDL